MIKYRLRFSKFGDTKYISHLDLIRLFERANKRAELPLSYSEGFNPHPKMSAALPLSVGVSSVCECIDISYDKEIGEEYLKETLNSKMPEGVEITGVKKLVEGDESFRAISMAAYKVSVWDCHITQENISAFLSQKEIIIEKTSKSKTREVDILPAVYSLEIAEQNEKCTIFKMTLSAGDTANLKPDLLLTAMEKYIEGFIASDFDILREKILKSDGKPIFKP